jgi:ubiquinol-cytochrome c reductase iron-sulfur subunit
MSDGNRRAMTTGSTDSFASTKLTPLSLAARATGILQHRTFSTSRAVERATTDIPDFTPYMAQNPNTNRTLSYFMVGSMGLLAASGAKSTVSDILSNMAASADVLALAKVEVEMSAIPEGKNLIVKWRGKPVFIRHRTADEIEEANKVDVKSLRDPQADDDRVKRPEWLVMLGVCIDGRREKISR